jgi:hypothetical protein
MVEVLSNSYQLHMHYPHALNTATSDCCLKFRSPKTGGTVPPADSSKIELETGWNDFAEFAS